MYIESKHFDGIILKNKEAISLSIEDIKKKAGIIKKHDDPDTNVDVNKIIEHSDVTREKVSPAGISHDNSFMHKEKSTAQKKRGK
jgi:hypothetical protein